MLSIMSFQGEWMVHGAVRHAVRGCLARAGYRGRNDLPLPRWGVLPVRGGLIRRDADRLAQPRRRRPRGVGRNPASASAWARGVSYTPVPSARSTVRRPRAPPRTASASPAAGGTSTPGSLVQDSSVLPPRSTYSTRCPSDSTTSAPALRPGRCAPGTSPGRAGQGSAAPNALAGSAAASTVMGGPAFSASPGAPVPPGPPPLQALPSAPGPPPLQESRPDPAVSASGGGSPGQRPGRPPASSPLAAGSAAPGGPSGTTPGPRAAPAPPGPLSPCVLSPSPLSPCTLSPSPAPPSPAPPSPGPPYPFPLGRPPAASCAAAMARIRSTAPGRANCAAPS